MQNRIQITALRDCCLLALFTDAENKETARKQIDLNRGESRGDIQFVLGLYPEYTDFPVDYSHHEDEKEMLTVPHPTRVHEVTESYGVIRLQRLP